MILKIRSGNGREWLVSNKTEHTELDGKLQAEFTKTTKRFVPVNTVDYTIIYTQPTLTRV